MTTQIKAILFDKDGTLLDFDATWAAPQEQAAQFAAHGDPELAQRLLIAGGMDPKTRKTASGSLFAAGNAEEIAQAFIETGVKRPERDLVQELDRIFLDGMRHAAFLGGLADTLSQLTAAGYSLGVASSDSEASIAAFLEATGSTGHFSYIAGYDSGYGHKPGPGMVHGFAEALEVPPNAIAVIGDNTHDLEMADAAGAGLKIGVLSGTGSREDLEPLADIILESAASLSETLYTHQ